MLDSGSALIRSMISLIAAPLSSPSSRRARPASMRHRPLQQRDQQFVFAAEVLVKARSDVLERATTSCTVKSVRPVSRRISTAVLMNRASRPSVRLRRRRPCRLLDTYARCAVRMRLPRVAKGKLERRWLGYIPLPADSRPGLLRPSTHQLQTSLRRFRPRRETSRSRLASRMAFDGTTRSIPCAVLLFVAVLFSAAPASADPNDNAFVDALAKGGIVLPDDNAAIAMAHTVCAGLDQRAKSTFSR